MKATNTAFPEIVLHDARIDSIHSRPLIIEIRLREAFLSPQHPANDTSGWLTVTPALLSFSGVTRTEARFWHDPSREWRPHPDICAAIEGDILESEFCTFDGDAHFLLTGFRAPGYTEWRIFTRTFELSWNADHPYS